MGRYTDNAPVKNTCPKIDEVIGFINGIDYSIEDLEISIGDVQYVLNVLEEIRSANLSLREWGNEELGEKENLEKDRDELLSQIESLNQQIKILETDLDDANNALSDVIN